MWFAYIVECSDKSLYTGITKDLNRRLAEHNSPNLGARYTRGRRPVKLLYGAVFIDRSTASKEEVRIKKLSKFEKKKLIKANKKTRV